MSDTTSRVDQQLDHEGNQGNLRILERIRLRWFLVLAASTVLFLLHVLLDRRLSDRKLLHVYQFAFDMKPVSRSQRLKIERIYYINLDNRTDKRAFMEHWLDREVRVAAMKNQTILYDRISALIANDDELCCAPRKQEPSRCRGIVGLRQSNFKIMENYNTSRLTLVMEDDVQPTEQSDFDQRSFLERVGDAIASVPDDWDVIRLDCWGRRPSNFVAPVAPQVFETRVDPAAPACYSTPPCWFCGGTHATIWRQTSIHKLKTLWSVKPYDGIDCTLSSPQADLIGVRSYCVNRNLVRLTDFGSDIPKR